MSLSEVEVENQPDCSSAVSEIQIFAEKCHLSYFDKESKTWKTIGVGVIKILECKDSLQFRVIMTTKKLNNVCADHLITCRMKLLSKDFKLRSFTYWSKIKQTDSKEECLKVKFANKIKASQFVEIFNQCCRKLNEDDKVSIDKFTEDSEDIHQVGRRFVCQARHHSNSYLNTNEEDYPLRYLNTNQEDNPLRYLNTNKQNNPVYSTEAWVAQTNFVGSRSYPDNKGCFRVVCTDTTITDTSMKDANNIVDVETDQESKELSLTDRVQFSSTDTTFKITNLTDSEDSFEKSYHSCLVPEKVTNRLETNPSDDGSSLNKPYPTTNVNHEVLNTETMVPNYPCAAEPLLPCLDLTNASRPENVNRSRNQDRCSNTVDTTEDTALSAPAIPPPVFTTNSFQTQLECPLFYNSFNEQQTQEQDNVSFDFPTREQVLSITKPRSGFESSSTTKTHQTNTYVTGNQGNNSKDNFIMDTQPRDDLNYSLNENETINDLVGAGKTELDSEVTDLPQVADETENIAPKARKIITRSNIFKRRQNQKEQNHEMITQSHVNEHGDVGITVITGNITNRLAHQQNTIDDINVQVNTELRDTKENQSTELFVLKVGKGDTSEVKCNDEEGDPVHTGNTCRNCEGGGLNVDEQNGDTYYTGQNLIKGDVQCQSDEGNGDTYYTGQNHERCDKIVESGNDNGDTTSISQNLKEGDLNVVSVEQNGDTSYTDLINDVRDRYVDSINQVGGINDSGENDPNEKTIDQNGDTNYAGQKGYDGDMNSEFNHQIVDARSTGDQKDKDGDPNVESKDHISDTSHNREDLDPKVISKSKNGDTRYTCQFHEDSDSNVESDDRNGDTTFIGQNSQGGNPNVESDDRNGDTTFIGQNSQGGNPNVESDDQNGDTTSIGQNSQGGDPNVESDDRNSDTTFIGQNSQGGNPNVESDDRNGDTTSIEKNLKEGDFDIESDTHICDISYTGHNLEDGDKIDESNVQNCDKHYTGQEKEVVGRNNDSDIQINNTNITCQKGDEGDSCVECNHHIGDTNSSCKQSGDGDQSVESNVHNSATNYTVRNKEDGDPNGDSSYIGYNRDSGDFNVQSACQSSDTRYTNRNVEYGDPNEKTVDQNCDTTYTCQDKEFGDGNVESNTQMGDTNVTCQQVDTNSESHYQNGDTSEIGDKDKEGDMNVVSNVRNSDTNDIGINRENGDPNNESNNLIGDIMSTDQKGQGDDMNVETEGQNGDTKLSGQNRRSSDPNVESNDLDGDTNYSGQNIDDIDSNVDTVNQNVDTNYTYQHWVDLVSNDQNGCKSDNVDNSDYIRQNVKFEGQNGYISYTVDNSGQIIKSEDQNLDTVDISKKSETDYPNNSDNRNSETLYPDENNEPSDPPPDDATVTDHNMTKTYENNITNENNVQPSPCDIKIVHNSSDKSIAHESRDLSSVDNTCTTYTTTTEFIRKSGETSISTSQLLQSNVKSKRKFNNSKRKHRNKKKQDERNADTKIQLEKDFYGVGTQYSEDKLNSKVGEMSNQHVELNGDRVKQEVTDDMVDGVSTLMLPVVGKKQVDTDNELDSKRKSAKDDYNAVDKQGVGTEQVDTDIPLDGEKNSAKDDYNAVDKQVAGKERVDSENAFDFNAVDKQEVGKEQIVTDNTLDSKRNPANDDNEIANIKNGKKEKTIVVLESQTKIDDMRVEVNNDDLDECCTRNAVHIPERKYSANEDSNPTRDDDTLNDEIGDSPIEIIIQVDDVTDERKEVEAVENVSQCYARKVNKKRGESYEFIIGYCVKRLTEKLKIRQLVYFGQESRRVMGPVTA
ncbi:probable cyclin-dependent serine/threonine-protein kinase DDB_G0292550 [Physella acuta]|uniref:probable cyclin-dependent serine/threonine-protein kinase DDB_G0292550 n=1 Tax=Physella acuta TaxID=109671 RepID=UPI0027DDEB34|nr:probable cyclin-dependent serine/threonine-protein kinase DDB_G0292550 [Physella acuta]